MERREFFGSFLATLTAAATLPEIARALEDYMGSLKRELDGITDDANFWERAQREFLLQPGLIHFNCGSIGATPAPIVEAHKAYIDRLEENPYAQTWSGIGSGTFDTIQQTAARFLRADTDEVFLTRNTTEGMNLVAGGMRLEPGDEILTTDHEHPGGVMCWLHMAALHGVRVRQIHLPTPTASKDEILQLVEDGITPRTRVCSFSHVNTTTGLRMPLAEIAAITRPRDILLACDGAQVPGMLAVDVKQLQVDTYASSSHKWMLAPKGTGLLYVRKEVQDRIRPVSAFASGGGSYYAPYTAGGGTRNLPVLLAHRDTMTLHNILGRERVEQRVLQLNAYLRQRLAADVRLTPVTPEAPELSSAMASYRVRGMAVNTLFDELKKRDIIIKRTAYNSVLLDNDIPNEHVSIIRLSTHIFNSEAQIDRLAEELADILGTTTSVGSGSSAPTDFVLRPNYPNPFNESTNIRFQLPQAEHVEIAVYNAEGQLVDVLQDGWREAGAHQLTWNAAERASGPYFYQVTAGSDREVRKMLLLR
ncbi:MAG: aminotransferase class V-fold PLP-dependent enzyme [Gemmatimonadetes bacterium]|jgi:isopenicillin-N epimerase|nr:aminotransferase class V-fold PLP-dependent enzyme [Gemmatimonadota bacterium]